MTVTYEAELTRGVGAHVSKTILPVAGSASVGTRTVEAVTNGRAGA